MKRQRRLFSSQLDEKLVDTIRQHPEIYDLSHGRYTDTVHKTYTWNLIGETLKLDPQLCKQRWESLRSQYRKKRRIRRLKADQSPTHPIKWKYEDLLEFLHPHMRDQEPLLILDLQKHPQDSASDDDDDQTETEVKVERLLDSPSPGDSQQLNSEISIKTSDSENSETCTNVKFVNRKLTLDASSSNGFTDFLLEDEKKSKKAVKVVKDELDLFFESMKETVRKFSAADKHIAKQQIFMAVSEIESKYV